MKLLVSVRNLDEAFVAAESAVGIIDLKEPDRGSLGAVSPGEAEKVGNRLGDWCTLSLAVGELVQFDHIELFDLNVLRKFAFAKIGLAGCLAVPDWQSRWLEWASRVGHRTSPVIVGYADHRECRAPDIREVVDLAVHARTDYFLIDTCHKNGSNLLDHCSLRDLDKIFQPLHDKGIRVAVAGSLAFETIEQLASLQPDVVAVRGAVCEGNNRNRRLCSQRIAELKKHLLTISVNENAS